MSGNLNIRQPQDPQRINVSEPKELRYWTKWNSPYFKRTRRVNFSIKIEIVRRNFWSAKN